MNKIDKSILIEIELICEWYFGDCKKPQKTEEELNNITDILSNYTHEDLTENSSFIDDLERLGVLNELVEELKKQGY